MKKVFANIAPALLPLCLLFLFSFPHEAMAVSTCHGLTASLDSSTYSANVGSTFPVVFTFTESNSGFCTEAIQDNTSGSFTTVPNTDIDIDCNGSACSSSGLWTSPKTVTLKCEAAGTYTIRGADIHLNFGSDLFTSNSTVTCNASASAPTVTTSAADTITISSANVNGNVTATNGADATTCGFAWGTGSALSGGDTATTTGSTCPGTTGSFSGNLSSLSGSTSYYFRAYAINSAGTGFGSILSLNTAAAARPSMMEFWGGFFYMLGGQILIK